jgi:hypothetical protein
MRETSCSFVVANRALSESMQAVISRHPSLEDLKYINDLSSVLIARPSLVVDQEEHIYQELIRVRHSISTPPVDHVNDVDENKENRPPLMPIKCPVSRIPVWTPPDTSKITHTPDITSQNQKYRDGLKKMTPKTRPAVSGECFSQPLQLLRNNLHHSLATTHCLRLEVLNEWSSLLPNLKDVLVKTSKMPLRVSTRSFTRRSISITLF